jgi:hypothetical protein
MSERTLRRLDRIVREAPPDLVDALRAGTVRLNQPDRRLAARRAGQVPTGPVHARETGNGRAGGESTEAPIPGERSSLDDRRRAPDRPDGGSPRRPPVAARGFARTARRPPLLRQPLGGRPAEAVASPSDDGSSAPVR